MGLQRKVALGPGSTPRSGCCGSCAGYAARGPTSSATAGCVGWSANSSPITGPASRRRCRCCGPTSAAGRAIAALPDLIRGYEESSWLMWLATGLSSSRCRLSCRRPRRRCRWRSAQRPALGEILGLAAGDRCTVLTVTTCNRLDGNWAEKASSWALRVAGCPNLHTLSLAGRKRAPVWHTIIATGVGVARPPETWRPPHARQRYDALRR